MKVNVAQCEVDSVDVLHGAPIAHSYGVDLSVDLVLKDKLEKLQTSVVKQIIVASRTRCIGSVEEQFRCFKADDSSSCCAARTLQLFTEYGDVQYSAHTLQQVMIVEISDDDVWNCVTLSATRDGLGIRPPHRGCRTSFTGIPLCMLV
jgi:hypothetical protein